MTKFLVIYERTKTGYSAFVPDLPGCVATGSNRKQAEKNIFDAIRFHIEGMKNEGLPVPKYNAESELLVFINK